MCRFARNCIATFNELVRELPVTLGPDTAELKLRVGMHSGQVTAGVLRGDRARFSLFGDTVNTGRSIDCVHLPVFIILPETVILTRNPCV